MGAGVLVDGGGGTKLIVSVGAMIVLVGVNVRVGAGVLVGTTVTSVGSSSGSVKSGRSMG